MTYYKYDEDTLRAKSRFEKNYNKTDSCWNYNSRLDKEGYGHISINILGKEYVLRAHRYSWIIHNQKDWPEDCPIARHTCNNPSCVNPEHIIPGTQQENVKDAIKSKTFKPFTGWKKGMKRPTLTCPHCNKTAVVSNSNRWHFDNCRHKP